MAVPSNMAYIGVLPCGCVVTVMVDAPRYRKHVAGWVKEAILDGCSIERMTVEAARGRWTGRACAECRGKGEADGTTD